jgi:hypothetical protein
VAVRIKPLILITLSGRTGIQEEKLYALQERRFSPIGRRLSAIGAPATALDFMDISLHFNCAPMGGNYLQIKVKFLGVIEASGVGGPVARSAKKLLAQVGN